jgi:hypothetical protein
MRRFFRVLAVIFAIGTARSAAAQALPPACPADAPPARGIHLPAFRLSVLADSAFLAMRAASQDSDTATSRFRVRVQPSGAVEVLCAYRQAGGGPPLMAEAAGKLRFGRESNRPFHDTATVDVTLAVSRPPDDVPVHRVERRVTVGDGVRVELAQLAFGAPAARFSGAEQVAIYRAAIERVRAEEREGAGVRCVVFTRGRGPDRELAAELNRTDAPVVAARDCPPTRFTGAANVDDSRIPAGWADPYRIELAPLDAWAADTAALNVVLARSNHSSLYTCVVVREGHGWRAECRGEWSRVVGAAAPRGTGRARG